MTSSADILTTPTVRCAPAAASLSVAYFVRVRGGGEAGDRDAKVSKALGPIFTASYLQSLQKRSCRLQPKFFGELAQVRSVRPPPVFFARSAVGGEASGAATGASRAQTRAMTDDYFTSPIYDSSDEKIL